MQPDPKQTAPKGADDSPLGEAIAIVPGSFDSEAATSQTDTPDAPSPKTPSMSGPGTIPVSTEAGTRTIQPLSDVTRPVPITDKVDPSDWFKPDTTPVKKQTFMTMLSVKFLKHRRLYSISLAVAIMLVWGGVFAYFAVHGKQTQPGKGTSEEHILVPSSATGQNEGQDTDVTVPAIDEQTSSTSGSEAGNADTGQLIVSGNDGEGNGGTSPSAPAAQHQTYTVSYTNSCFTPSSVSIKNGDTVTFVNNSNKNMWPASDPHPQHTLYPEFDARKDIAPGGSYSFTFTRIGSWGYHDHNKPSCHGTVVVSS